MITLDGKLIIAESLGDWWDEQASDYGGEVWSAAIQRPPILAQRPLAATSGRAACPGRPSEEVMMAATVSDVMTANPETIEADEPVMEAARRMRDADIGDVIVLDGGRVVGIVTDRDIAIRVVAEGKDSSTPVRDACSTDVKTVTPDTSLAQAVQLMRDNAVRRLPVVDNDQAVGVVSLGDLAMELDQESALADISAAAPDN